MVPSVPTADMVTAARPRNPRGEGRLLREQLLAAAVTVLDVEGDASRVSVRAIAKAAGVSPTALYLQFPDRDALVEAAVDRSFATFNTAILAAAAAHDDPRERVRAMGLAYLGFTERQPALYAVLFSTRRQPGRPPSAAGADPPPVPRQEALEGLAAAVAATGPGGGPARARELALFLWAALHGYAVLRVNRPLPGWPAAEPYVDGLLDAFLGT